MKRVVGVLAGGLSKRMGRKKEVLEICGKRMLYAIISKIIDKYDTCLSLSSDSRRLFVDVHRAFPSLRIVTDRVSFNNEYNPLVGIYSLLASCRDSCVVVWAGDSPFINQNIVDELFSYCKMGFDAVLPLWRSGRIDPVHAAYSTKVSGIMYDLLSRDPHISLHSVIEKFSNVFFIPNEGMELILADVDTPLEYGFIKRFCNGRL